MTDHIDDIPLPEPQATLPPPVSFVVGLGASAGGIQALTRFFAHALADAPIAYVVILHLSPDHESRLAEVLQRATSLAVTQVRENVTLAPGHVYVIPPSSSLRVSGGALVVSPQTGLEQRRAPIDIFFRTLADAYGGKAAAVILSGTGADGSSGMKRVKEYGGLTMAQDPDEAEHGEMPAAAIGTGLVDCVLPVAEMPRRIVEYQQRASVAADPPRGPSPAAEADALRDIMTLLRAGTGHDFADYKPATVRRRIERRMMLHAVSSLAAYAQLLHEQPDEARALMKELLISVTNFFRDPEPFRFLEERIIPQLFDGRTSADQVRAWSAGCATGEEAYSIAMLLAEHASGLLGAPAVQVFATDLDESAIAFAREGRYSDADVADLSPERLQRFFQRDGQGYRARRELREMVLFAQHNVIKDPPFSHLDLIACRNVLIYLNRTIQARLMNTFSFALRGEGYLFLGTSESADDSSGLFGPVDNVSHIYQCRPTRVRMHAALADLPRSVEPPNVRRDAKPAERIAAGELHLRLLEQFAPPSLVVGDDHALVHASERVGEFLHLSGGEPSRDVLKLIRPELRADLRTALHLATKERRRVEVRGARLARPQGDVLVTVVVRPVLRAGTARGYFLVLFEEEGATPLPAEVALRIDTHLDSENVQLQDEVLRLKDQLRSTIEESDAQVEDAKAANEELQAMNEELRSSTEELETSKEELQSANEELATVNQELKIKIEELALSNNDFRNLINSTEIGAIFLDRSLRVKLATPRAQEVFNLMPADTGRLLSDITHRLVYPELHNDVDRVMRDLQTVEREVPARDGRWFLVRVMPYRTADDRIEGAALTFHDISTRRAAEEDVRGSEERLRLLIDSAVDYAIFTMDPDGLVASWNPGAERVFGYKAEDILGADCAILFTPEDRVAGIPQQELLRAATSGRAEDERWHLRKGGERFYSSGVTTRLGKAGRGFAKIARDLTERRQHEMALDEARTQLEARVQQRTAELQAEVEQHEAARRQVTTLLRKIVTAQEDERTRIARDLHDQLGQQLTALRLALERHVVVCQAPRREDLDRALALARELDTEIDFLAWELRPAALDDLGLAAALPRYVEQWGAHYGIQAQFQTTGQLAGLRPEAEVAFYRVAQEALNNVLKHAHASRVDVLLEARDGSIVLVIEDDGVGFDPADPAVHGRGIGLMGMRERAALIGGTVQIESAPGKGTTVFFRCPLGSCEAPA